jgi:hypothetical protein
MAAPHVAGVAALIKQKNPALGPSEIASALTTTATTADGRGNPLLAQRPSHDPASPLGPATPFDFGGGEVDPTAALDPGLVFPAGKEIKKILPFCRRSLCLGICSADARFRCMHAWCGCVCVCVCFL